MAGKSDRRVELTLRTEADRASLASAVGTVRAGLAQLKQQTSGAAGVNVAPRGMDQLRTFGTYLAGGAMAYGMANMVRQAAEFGDELDETSKKTGIAGDRLQFLRFAAGQTGLEFTSAAMANKFLQSAIYDASAGSKTAAEKFEALGVSVESLKGKDLVQSLPALAEGFARIKDEGTRGALAVDLFGRAGREMLPLLSGGRQGIDELAAGFERAGGAVKVLGPESADKLKALADSFTNLKLRIGMAGVEELGKWSDKLIGLSKTTGEIVEKHGSMILSMIKYGALIYGGIKAWGFASAAIEGILVLKDAMLVMTGRQIAAEETLAGVQGLTTKGVIGLTVGGVLAQGYLTNKSGQELGKSEAYQQAGGFGQWGMRQGMAALITGPIGMMTGMSFVAAHYMGRAADAAQKREAADRKAAGQGAVGPYVGAGGVTLSRSGLFAGPMGEGTRTRIPEGALVGMPGEETPGRWSGTLFPMLDKIQAQLTNDPLVTMQTAEEFWRARALAGDTPEAGKARREFQDRFYRQTGRAPRLGEFPQALQGQTFTTSHMASAPQSHFEEERAGSRRERREFRQEFVDRYGRMPTQDEWRQYDARLAEIAQNTGQSSAAFQSRYATYGAGW
jgi:hypothetical protein